MIIREIVLCTNKLRELRNFYSETLELHISREEEDSISLNTESSVVTFNTDSAIEHPFYHFAFNIPENQFQEAKQWVMQKTELIKLNGQDEFDFKSWNAHSFYFYDPAGNIVEFIVRHSLDNSSRNKFSGKSILGISEIGLPVNSVRQFYKELNSNIEIPEFSGDKETFCAAGDDNGLFIIVPEGRKWFPDCGEAKIFPTIVKIDSYQVKEFEIENLPYKIITSSK